MRKIVLLFFVVLFMAVPALAVSTVTIHCTPTVDEVNDINWITISYSSDHNRIRAFGIDINVAPFEGMEPNIIDVCSLNLNYRIYPGQISIVEGDVNDYMKPYDPCDLGDANVAVEMGSLYTTDAYYASDVNAGYNMIPGTSGDLLKFSVKNGCVCIVDVNERRGGIVMEDPYENPSFSRPLCEVNVCGGGCTVPNVVGMTQAAATTAINNAGLVVGVVKDVNGDATPIGNVVAQSPTDGGRIVTCGTAVDINVAAYCMKSTHPDYTFWVLHNRPKCWCYAKQCRGDSDGKMEGIFWVGNADKTLLVQYLNKFPDAPPPSYFVGACADFTHSQDGGLFWVSNSDKTVLVQYLNKPAVPPDCDATYINFWCTPGSTTLGCP